ncbi:hypothetical protein [Nostoc sp. PA-18-2419]|uniref:hypothetical protein n=1 Tax=Nostoc sp. PA-18-2419 TaxID=2575443 RepID=UPI0016782226|nr:hypothetical protein [Nostoc sp. PA-18-2419]
MANIAISNLRPAGADLFDGSESFMNDLTDSELDMTKGGLTPAFFAGVAVGIAITYALK